MDRATKDCRVRKVQAVQQVHRVAVVDKENKAIKVHKAM